MKHMNHPAIAEIKELASFTNYRDYSQNNRGRYDNDEKIREDDARDNFFREQKMEEMNRMRMKHKKHNSQQSN